MTTRSNADILRPNPESLHRPAPATAPPCQSGRPTIAKSDATTHPHRVRRCLYAHPPQRLLGLGRLRGAANVQTSWASTSRKSVKKSKIGRASCRERVENAGVAVGGKRKRRRPQGGSGERERRRSHQGRRSHTA